MSSAFFSDSFNLPHTPRRRDLSLLIKPLFIHRRAKGLSTLICPEQSSSVSSLLETNPLPNPPSSPSQWVRHPLTRKTSEAIPNPFLSHPISIHQQTLSVLSSKYFLSLITFLYLHHYFLHGATVISLLVYCNTFQTGLLNSTLDSPTLQPQHILQRAARVSYENINQITGLHCSKPHKAFYHTPNKTQSPCSNPQGPPWSSNHPPF